MSKYAAVVKEHREQVERETAEELQKQIEETDKLNRKREKIVSAFRQHTVPVIDAEMKAFAKEYNGQLVPNQGESNDRLVSRALLNTKHGHFWLVVTGYISDQEYMDVGLELFYQVADPIKSNWIIAGQSRKVGLEPDAGFQPWLQERLEGYVKEIEHFKRTW